MTKNKNEQPSAAIFDCRTVQSTPESGERTGYDGYKRKKGSKIRPTADIAIDLGVSDKAIEKLCRN